MGLTVGELSVQLDAATKEFRAGLQSAEKRITRFERQAQKSTDKTERSFARLGKRVGGVAAGFVALTGAATAYLGLNIARSAVQQAAAFELIESQLTTLTGSAAKAAELLAEVERIAARTPFALEGVAAAASSVSVVFGEDTERAAEFTRVVADLGAAFQIPIEEVGSNFIRAMSAGLSAADLFRDRGITKLILDMAGVSKASEISREELEELFLQLTGPGGKAFQAAERAADTLGGALSNVGDAAAQFQRRLGRALAPTVVRAARRFIIPFFEDLTKRVEENADKIQEFADDVIPAFVAGFGAISLGISIALDTVLALVKAIDGLRTAYQFVTTETKETAQEAETGARALEVLGTAMRGTTLQILGFEDASNAAAEKTFKLNQQLGDSIRKQDELSRQGGEASDVLDTFETALSKSSETAQNFAVDLFNLFKQMREGQKDTEETKKSVDDLSDSLKNALPEAEFQRAADVFAQNPLTAGVQGADPESFGEQEARDRVDATNEAAEKAREELKAAADTFGASMTSTITDAAGLLGDEFGQVIEGFGPLLSEGLSKGFEAAGLDSRLGGLVSGIANAAVALAGAFGGGGGGVSRDAVRSAVTSTQAVRGVVAGPQNIAIAQVDTAIRDSFVETNSILEQIERNTRGTARGVASASGAGAVDDPLANESESFV